MCGGRRNCGSRNSKGKVVFLGDSSAPAAIVKILEKGPKFATEPSVKPTEMLPLVRQVSEKVTPDNRERCVLECVEGLTREGRRPVRKMELSAVMPCFKDSQLKLLCDVKHRTPYVACASGVVYQIPLSCGRVYIDSSNKGFCKPRTGGLTQSTEPFPPTRGLPLSSQ
ncbi:hypothetical protein HPB47_025533 [Ixodes persulcatus]|uniref:Uncharacterized protein n=1 Tax=Ixodes persulcatus TaxID=34615 RepID=A0AC60Q1K3_IXOPE|nr:hypothetical protein HPB47_025533 [Ixodes persulcatus]